MAQINGLFDRYRLYRKYRRDRPVFRGEDGCWHVYSYADVKRVISEHEVFSAKVPFGDNMMGETMMRQDPPEHRRLRTLSNHAFTARRIAALEPRITEIAAGRLAEAESVADELDVITALAAPLPIMVIAEMLGVEPDRHAEFKRWSEIFMSHGVRTPDADMVQRIEEMRIYVAETIERQRRSPRDDLIGTLVQAEVDGGKLTAEELIGFCYLLLLAGNETTANLIGNTAISLALHPEILARVHADRSLVPAVIEETLRYLSPVQILVRLTRREVTLGGVRIPPGEKVFAYIGSGNRDEAQFPEADRFLLHGREQHLGFGHGVHFCLGAPLGRLACRVAINALLDRLPGRWEIVDKPLEQVPAFFLCGVTSLPLMTR